MDIPTKCNKRWEIVAELHVLANERMDKPTNDARYGNMSSRPKTTITSAQNINNIKTPKRPNGLLVSYLFVYQVLIPLLTDIIIISIIHVYDVTKLI